MLGSGPRYTQAGQANAFAFQVSSEEWANCTASSEVDHKCSLEPVTLRCSARTRLALASRLLPTCALKASIFG